MDPKTDVQKHIKGYIAILAGLIVLTLVSVGISQLDLRAGVRVFLVLVIASIQATLSVAYLMHLNWERRFVHVLLILTLFFFLSLLFLPTLTYFDRVEYHHVP